MSFFTVIEADASEVEAAVVAGLKTAANYVDNVVVTDILPALESALLAAIGKFGQVAVADILTVSLAAPAAPPTAAPTA